jgi:hypothetical protein
LGTDELWVLEPLPYALIDCLQCIYTVLTLQQVEVAMDIAALVKHLLLEHLTHQWRIPLIKYKLWTIFRLAASILIL